MTKDITFYREVGIETKFRIYWYADVKEHSKDENIMIGNASTFLEDLYYHCEFIDTTASNRITLTVTDDDTEDYIFMFRKYAHNGYGASYDVYGRGVTNYKITVDTLWLCNVVHTLFGEHPKEFKVLMINHQK